MFASLLDRHHPSSRIATSTRSSSIALLLLACGGSPPPAEHAESSEAPAAVTHRLGAPKDTRYMADVEAERGRIRVVVREESRCDLIPVRTVVENGETRWIAGTPSSSQACDRRVTRTGVVSLEVHGSSYRLGEPNALGEVRAQLSDQMLQQLYGSDTQAVPVAQIMLRDRQGRAHQIGSVQLSVLARTEGRLEELLTEFRGLLERSQSELSGTELARSYELYEQLSAFDSNDPRIRALQALFLERLYQRKADEATERFKKNLQALGAAKEILKSNRTTLVLPSYVSNAIDSGTLDAETVAWARGQVALTLRKQRDLCGSPAAPGFKWSLLELSPPPVKSRLAFQVLRFAYDDPYESELSALCQRVVM